MCHILILSLLAAGNIAYDATAGNLLLGSDRAGIVLDAPLDLSHAAGMTLFDVGPDGVSLTTSGSPTIDGDGMTLDGTAYAARTEADWRSGDSAGAVSIWYKSSTTAFETLFASSDTATGTHYFWLYVDTTGRLVYRVIDGGTADFLVCSNITGTADGAWHHAWVESNDTTISAYVDGVACTLNATTGSNDGKWLAEVSGRDNLTAGVIITSSTTNYFTGTLARLRVFSSVPSAATRAQIYACGHTGCYMRYEAP